MQIAGEGGEAILPLICDNIRFKCLLFEVSNIMSNSLIHPDRHGFPRLSNKFYMSSGRNKSLKIAELCLDSP